MTSSTKIIEARGLGREHDVKSVEAPVSNHDCIVWAISFACPDHLEAAEAAHQLGKLTDGQNSFGAPEPQGYAPALLWFDCGSRAMAHSEVKG